MKPIFIFFIVAALVIAGCTAQNTTQDAGQGQASAAAANAPVAVDAPVNSNNGQAGSPPAGQQYPRGAGGFGNATDRAAINLVMTQACAGLNENDTCTFSIPNGRSGDGTCRLMNQTLYCRGSGGGFRRGNGTAPQPPVPTN